MAKTKVAKKAIKKITKTKPVKATKASKPVKEIKQLKPRAQKAMRGDIVVHSPINPGQEFVVASEFADDEAIEAELMGKAMDSFVYSFPQEGKTVTGLTVSGVNEMSRLLTKKKDSGIKIRIVPDSIRIERDVEMEGIKGVSVTLIAENMLTGETGIGAKFEPYSKTGKKGKYANTFALEKAVSKAERNAKRKLIPEKVAIEMIKKFVQQGAVREIGPGNGQAGYNQLPAQQPAPVQNNINYIGKLVTMLARECNIKIEGDITKEQLSAMIQKFNDYTGQNIRSLKVGPQTAQRLLLDFVNSPIMLSK